MSQAWRPALDSSVTGLPPHVNIIPRYPSLVYDTPPGRYGPFFLQEHSCLLRVQSLILFSVMCLMAS